MKEKYYQFFNKLPPGYRELCILRFNESIPAIIPGDLGDAIAFGCSHSEKEPFHFWSRMISWADYPDLEVIPYLPRYE